MRVGCGYWLLPTCTFIKSHIFKYIKLGGVSVKKGVFILFMVVIVSAILFSGCNNSGEEGANSEFIVGSDMVKYDLQGVSDFGFNVNLIAQNKDLNVEFVSFVGENTQGLSVQLKDDSYDEIKGLKHSGYYIKLLGFVCKTGGDYVQIDSVNLKINGAEQKIDFATPIKHYAKKDDSKTSVQVRNYPMFISTNSYATTEYNFEYYAEKDITIESFSFNNFLSIKSGRIAINGEDVGDINSFPLVVKKDSTVSIKCYLDFKDPNNTSEYDSIYCDSLLSYKTSESDEVIILANNLVSQSVSNEDDAKKVIELMIE